MINFVIGARDRHGASGVFLFFSIRFINRLLEMPGGQGRTSSNGVWKLELGIAKRCGCLGGVHTVDDAGTGLADAWAADSSVALHLGDECGNEDGESVVAA